MISGNSGNKRIKRIIFYFIAISIALFFLIIIVFAKLLEKETEETSKCQYLNNDRYGKDLAYVTCFEIFSIESEAPWIEDKRIYIYNIRDDQHDYDIASITNLKRYKIYNNFLYIFDDAWKKLSAPDRSEPVNYGRDFYVDGQVKEFTYPHLTDMPDYIQVEMSSGEVTLYNNYDQMPSEAKQIFSELEEK